MSVFHEQRICVKFCVNIGKSVTDTFEMLKIAFGGKSHVRDSNVRVVEVIKTNSLAHLRSIPKIAFQECFRSLKKRWQRCIQSRGEYFEGDNAE
jgi:hypothetical protein